MKWFQMHDRFGLREDADDIFNEDPDLAGNGDHAGDNDEPEIEFDPTKHDLDDEGNIINLDGSPITPAAGGKGAAAAPLTPEAIEAAVRGALANGGKAPNIQQEKELSPEEFNKLIEYRAVQEADIAVLMDPEKPAAEKAKALQDLLDARDKSNRILMRSMFEKLNGQFTEFQGTLAEQRREQARVKLIGSVVTKYPALKPYEHTLPQIFEALRQSGYRPKSAEEGLRMLASHAQSTIKQFNPQFSLASSTQARRTMATSVNSGGRTGAPGQKGKKPDWQDVW